MTYQMADIRQLSAAFKHVRRKFKLVRRDFKLVRRKFKLVRRNFKLAKLFKNRRTYVFKKMADLVCLKSGGQFETLKIPAPDTNLMQL